MNINFIKKLVKLVEESNIGEIQISRFGTRIRISKNGTRTPAQPIVETVPVPAPPLKENEEIKKEEVKEEKKENFFVVKSPIVGTFYRAPAPDANPYVEIGDIVKEGQVLCIIEAMKLMNEIESEVSGKITDIRVKNAEPVEYGQELFLIEPI